MSVGARRPVIIALLALLLAACTGPTHYFDYPPGGSHQQFLRDAKLCNIDSQTMKPWAAFGGRLPHQIDERFVQCMTQLGYVETPKREGEYVPFDKMPQTAPVAAPIPPPPGGYSFDARVRWERLHAIEVLRQKGQISDAEADRRKQAILEGRE